MKATISNFRGCAHAEIVIDGICLVAGKNGAGKSSMLQAVGAAVTATPIPYVRPKDGVAGETTSLLPKSGGELLVHRGGAETGTVVVHDDNGVASVVWPKAAYKAKGNPPKASVYAAGLVRYSELDAKARAGLLVELLAAEPTKAELADAIPEAPKETIDEIWTLIQASGWDAASKEMATRATKRKGEWEAITGTRYGDEKAKTWRPDAWTDDLETETKEALEAAVAAAENAKTSSIAQTAVSKAERDALAKAAASIADLLDAAKTASSVEKKAEAAYEEKRKARAALPEAEGQSGFTCPHCGGSVGITQSSDGFVSLHKFQATATLEENAARTNALKAVTEAMNAAKDELQSTQRYRATAELSLAAAIEAEKKLAALPPEDDGKKSSEGAAEALRLAEDRLSMFRALIKANGTAKSVNRLTSAAKVLGPTGLRKTTLADKMAKFNDRLSLLSVSAGWDAVRIDEALDLHYGEGLHMLVSGSEQFRADVIVSIAIAERDSSACVIIDGADILDAASRNGMFTMLRDLKIPSIVGMTMNRPDQVPDLRSAGMGVSYWMAGSIATEIGSTRHAAAAE